MNTKVGLLCLAAMSFARHLNALSVDGKGTFADIEDALGQEHQIEIARARYVMNEDDPAKMKILCIKFTTNPKGDGYILMSDNMDDSLASKELVYGKLRNVQTFDPLKLGSIPKGVSPQSDLARLMKTGATEGDSVLIYGDAVKRGSDGSESPAGTITVMAHVANIGNPSKRDSIAIFVTTKSDVTTMDKVIAGQLIYKGIGK